jgi:lipopolysaccharide/colanic/teichoic acid biosynthesis glycosyltransferase
MLHLDCEYAREATLWVDLKILVRTVPAVLAAKGAK